MQVDEHGMLAHRKLEDGRILALIPLTFGRVRLTVGHDFNTYEEGW